MQNLGLILLTFAFVFAFIEAVFMPVPSRVHFGWLAITCWIASELIGGLGRIFH